MRRRASRPRRRRPGPRVRVEGLRYPRPIRRADPHAPGPIAAVLEAAPDLYHRELRPAQRAADEVARILEAAPITLIPALDRAFRDGGLHRRLGRTFVDVAPAQVARLDRLERSQTAAYGISSLVRSGHAREAAIAGLRERRDPLALAFLVNRLGDYVGSIGDQAWAVLEDRLTPGLAIHLVAALPLIERMSGLVRATEARQRRLLQFLRGEDPRIVAALWVGARGADPEVAWAAARALRDRGGGPDELLAVYEAALRSRAPQLRIWAARSAADRRLTPTSVLEALTPRLVADRLPAIRVVGVHAAAARGDLEALRRAAFDGNGEVRHHARVHLARRSAPLDYRRLALATLARDGLRRDQAIGALATLSDFGRGEDRPAIERYAADPRPSVAREAARTLSLLDRL
ncbi:MAG: hypothetical protein R3B09_33205 [Nannocystaceae bacterium]